MHSKTSFAKTSGETADVFGMSNLSHIPSDLHLQNTPEDVSVAALEDMLTSKQRIVDLQANFVERRTILKLKPPARRCKTSMLQTF